MTSFKQLIGERIAQARHTAGMTIREVTQQIPEFKPARISNWENGHRTPGPNEVLMLAEVLGVSAPYLMGLTDIDEAKHESTDFFNLIPLYSSQDIYKRVQRKPLQVEQMIPLDNRHQSPRNDNLFAMNVFDSSMEPSFKLNDLLIAEIVKNPLPGSFIIALLKDSTTPILRKFRDTGSNGFQLIPENNDWPIITLASLDECQLCAVVIEHRQYYRR